MRFLGLVLGGLAVTFAGTHQAAANDKPLTLTLRGSMTTNSQLFTMPDSEDPFERAAFIPFGNQFGAGLELKYSFHETHLAVSFSVEYLEAFQSDQTPGGIPIEDGYKVVPVELTAYFIIPISGPTIEVFMGGGAGAYLGERVYTLGGVTAAPVNAATGFGIHVLGGASYRITEVVAITGEMKFRDLQFDASNAFRESEIYWNGRIIPVSTDPFNSRVHTDGIILNLGLAFSF
jgi:hypothetical protein